MNGILLGMVIMVSSPAPSVQETAAATIASGNSTFHRAGEARATLKLPRGLAIEPSRSMWRFEASREAQAPAAKGSSKTARIVGTALGALGGLWAGGMIGYRVTQERTDDDGVSGLRGVVIGVPIGAAVGALLGYQLAK
jgi:hypothetical protein